MANYENIKDANSNRTPSERRELAKNAGIASGKARRERANFNKTLNKLLTTEIDNEWKPILESLGLECTLESAMLLSQIKEAMKGNTKAAYFVAQYAGQSDKTDADLEEQSARTSQIKANTERIIRNSNDYDEGDGVTIVNDAPEDSEDIGYCDSEVSEDIQQQDD